MNATHNRYGTALRIYDNGGKTADRFTIIPPRHATEYRWRGSMNWGASWGWACITSSESGHVSGRETADPGHHLGRRIRWDALPERVQRFARDAFPEFVFNLETIARHFCTAAQWADAPEGTDPRVTREALNTARAFAREFLRRHPEESADAMTREGYGAHPDAGSPEAAFGHDLYLTSAGHGVGFGDRDELGDVGEALAEIIRKDWRRWHVETEANRGWFYISAHNYDKKEAA